MAVSTSRRNPSHALSPFFSSPADHFLRDFGFGGLSRPMNSLFREFDSVFNDSNLKTPVFAPNFNVKETEKTYELEGEFAGVASKDNISVEFSDDQTLVIKGSVQHSREVKPEAETTEAAPAAAAEGSTEETPVEGSEAKDEQALEKRADSTVSVQAQAQPRYWLSERSVGSFQRVFSFPEPIDHEAVTAKLEHGLLHVTVPKKDKVTTSRRVTVQ